MNSNEKMLMAVLREQCCRNREQHACAEAELCTAHMTVLEQGEAWCGRNTEEAKSRVGGERQEGLQREGR